LASFGEVWEEPVLKLVQHSYAPLDTLVLQAQQLLLSKFVPGEKVIFAVVSCIIHCFLLIDLVNLSFTFLNAVF